MSGISSANLIIDTEVPPRLAAWLSCVEPLTDKLKVLTGNACIKLCSQLWTASTWWDRYFLHIDEDSIFQREILMQSNQSTFWYARTVIPQSCYEVESDFFDRLEQESIRNLIYNESRVALTQRMIYSINAQCMEYCLVKNVVSVLPETLWVRLTEFNFQKSSSFYLLEVLFPQLEDLG